MRRKIRVLFCCTGIGVLGRGIESFFREAFDGLSGLSELDCRLLVGERELRSQKALEAYGSEIKARCLKRTGIFAGVIGKITGRSAYAVEQWSSLPSVVREIKRFRPDILFTSEANLIFLLRRIRPYMRTSFRMLYSNGGPVSPPFDRHDWVHQVAPVYRDNAIAAGEPPEKHIFVPYGIKTTDSPSCSVVHLEQLRRSLGLPLNRPIVLSVGWIARQHKRMDYVINEVANCRPLRPFLVMLGAMDEESPPVLQLARERLGSDNFLARTVPYHAVADYYRAADLFALASLAEGFGRVYLESLMHGLPTIGHRHPVIEWVLGDAGICADLSKDGSLTSILTDWLKAQDAWSTSQLKESRWKSIRDRFDWSRLQDEYYHMFCHAIDSPLPQVSAGS